MADQERARPPARDRKNSEETVDEAPADEIVAGGEDIDALLDEIDAVLEENAEEFVRNYVQKGGE
ncbi:MAG: ubiquitin-like protein Pup [Acidimicrobiia bacterium]|jgi:prokaryotic ubiquitin-like protein Pup